MADISQIAADGITYNIKDSVARKYSDISSLPLTNEALSGDYIIISSNGTAKKISPNVLNNVVNQEVQSGEDFNSYSTVGKYGVIYNYVAQSLRNCPSSYAGVLKVWNAVGDGRVAPAAGSYYYVAQEYNDYRGRTFRRNGETSGTLTVTWGEWKTYG